MSALIKNSFNLKKFAVFFVATLLTIFLQTQGAFAIYTGVRAIDVEKVRESQGTKCVTLKTKHINGGAEYFTNVNGLSFDTMFSNIDAEWQLDNPTCLGFTIGVGSAIKATGIAAEIACRFGAAAGIVSSIANLGGTINPKTAMDLAKAAGTCTTMIAAQDYIGAAMCCGAAGSMAVTVSTGVATLGGIFAVADNAYKTARICGHDWNNWQEDDNENWIRGPQDGSYAKCLKDLFLSNVTTGVCGSSTEKKLTNKAYREYIYGGKEYVDGKCKVPASWDSDKRNKTLGYTDDDQRYYMRGYGVASNFACNRFSMDQSDTDALLAYECCRERSQRVVCIEYYGTHQFCELGSNCAIGDITFSPYQSRVDSNYICARTYSVCPYNHPLGGGTEEECYPYQDCAAKMQTEGDGVMSEAEASLVPLDKRGHRVNFCQYRYHCTKKPTEPYISGADFGSGLIAAACKNMKGDSQNEYIFHSELLPLANNYRFSAPIVQCFKETLENVFLNIAGDTKCMDSNERPDKNGECASGYIYKKGEPLSTESFFAKIQNNLQSVIKMALILAITFFGAMILFAAPNALKRKDLVMLIVKIGLVLYFATGTAWQDFFFKGVIDSSIVLSDIALGLDQATGKPQNKLDGCQFPRYNRINDTSSTDINNPSYPAGKEYLKVWDTLDCKIAQAIGFGPGLSVPNLITMILAGFFTGGAGIVFLVGIFFFAFYLIFLTVRAVHMFMVSIMAIVILIYVSPLVIPAVLFQRTKDIFNQWWQTLLGFVLQPMILFAYLGIMLMLFDNILIGKSVTFSGEDGSPKTINCPKGENSIYCIFNISEVKTCGRHGTIECPGFEIIGLTIPFLQDFSPDKITAIIKAALIMYIFTQFLDKISDLSEKLVGGGMTKPWGNLKDIAGKALGMAKGVQGRANRGMRKHLLPKAQEAGKKAANYVGRGGIKETASNIKDNAQKAAEISAGIAKQTGNKIKQAGNKIKQTVTRNNKSSPDNKDKPE